MKDFLFRPEQARTPVKALSGGERGRLMLARALARPSNLLVLDEPTNDLDLETLDLLQEMLADYPGTLLLVSHDRDFLDRVVTSVIASEGDGKWTEYAGGYSDMVAQRGYGVGASAAGGEAEAGAQAGRRAAAHASRAAASPSPTSTRSRRRPPASKRSAPRSAAWRRPSPTRISTAAIPPPSPRPARPSRPRAPSWPTTEEEWLRLELLREEIEGG